MDNDINAKFEALRAKFEAGKGNAPTDGKEAAGEPIDAKAAASIAGEKDAYRQAAAVYRQYQAAIRAAGMLRADIKKGVLAGESPYKLLGMAADCIGFMTGDTLFSADIKRSVEAVYGHGLGDESALEGERERIAQRLERLKAVLASETDEDSAARIRNAIREHEKRLSRSPHP